MMTEQEIQDWLAKRMPDGAEGPSKWPGMTYEQGVQATADFITGYTTDDPLGED
jgi:hypothetical protein